MKKQIPTRLTHLLSLALLLLAASPAVAQSAAIGYQGRLTEGGSLATGAYDMQFKLFDSANVGAGVQRGDTKTLSAVPVANGVFTVTLDFGAAVFDGSPRFLEISVRPGGNAASPYTTLDPRQRVASIPYAIHSLSADAADTAARATTVVNGAVVQSLNNLKDNVTLAEGANVTITPSGNTLTIASTGGGGGGSGLWSLAGADAYYNAGSVGIGTNRPAPGVRLEVNGPARVTAGGSGGFLQIGTPNGETGMSIIGANRADIRFDGSTLKLLAGPGTTSPGTGITVDTLGNVGMTRNLLFGAQTRQMLNLFGTGFGIGVQTANLYYRSGAGFAWHVGGAHNNNTYDSGGGTTPMTLDLDGLKFGARLGQHLWLWSDPAATRYFGIGIQGSTLYNRCGGGEADGFAWYKGGIHDSRYHNGGGGQAVMFLDGNGLFVSGNTSVSTLSIRGGADLAEPFELSASDIAKGSVVIIDPENPGKLKLSHQSYDRRVAGVVSGANGVNSGITLHQEGVLEGGQNVALSGRVYVLADAVNGAITPGDLLTTSDTPGHAMKAGDYNRAKGAILGKAMTGLKAERGLVLVLVTLQ